MVSKKEKERQASRKAGRTQYDLPPELKDEVAALAAQLGVPQSQLATLLLEYGIKAIKNDKINLTEYRVPSRSPLFDFNLDLDRFRKERKK